MSGQDKGSWIGNIPTGKIQLKLVRSFGVGFEVMSPKLNGLCVVIYLGCFHVGFWNRGNCLFTAKSFWNG